jgi:predicted DNA-binding antitoxin AbrB/MazE fold protein
MTRSVDVIYDGEVFRPQQPLDLKANSRHTIEIQIDDAPAPVEPEAKTLWEWLDEMSGTVEGPADWSEEHDHYLYGTPKKNGSKG